MSISGFDDFKYVVYNGWILFQWVGDGDYVKLGGFFYNGLVINGLFLDGRCYVCGLYVFELKVFFDGVKLVKNF